MSQVPEAIAAAVTHHRAGRHQDAERIYRQVLEADPYQPDALHLLGVLAHQAGRHDAAIELISRAIGLKPRQPVFHSNLGLVHRARHELELATASFHRALDINPQYAEAHCNLGNTLKWQGKLDDAVACYKQALRIRPDYARALTNLGTAYKAQGRLDEAATCYRRALELDPELIEACLSLAAMLDDWNRFEDAVTFYRRALEIRPDDPQVMDCLFESLKNEGRPEEAADQIRRAIEIEPSDKRRFALATVLPMIQRSADEMTRYRRRLTDRLSALIADGVRFDSARDVLPSLFYLAYQGMNDRRIQEMVSRLYTNNEPAATALRRTRPDGAEKIRVGFLSRHLQNRHSVGKLTRGFIERLSRKLFHVVVLSLGEHNDPSAGQIRNEADQYVLVPPTVELARQTVADAALDVLIYPDIGMDPVTSALARARLAPVQCVMWGHPVTTGIPQIDYFLSSELIEPEDADEHYTEQLVKFKPLPAFYYRPELPASRKSRADFGLAEGRHVYLCPQNLFKIHPDFDRPLGDILRRDPVGEVVLIEGKAPRWRELLMERFRATFPDVIDRVKFLPRQSYDDFLHLIALADVVLDPFHFGGGNTTYQALSLGTPVVTWPSGFMRGRAAYGCYRKMGVLDCVATNMDHYADVATRLGTDAIYRKQIRERILAEAHTLFEDEEALRELEQFLLDVVEQECTDPTPPPTASTGRSA